MDKFFSVISKVVYNLLIFILSVILTNQIAKYFHYTQQDNILAIATGAFFLFRKIITF